ncbi:ROK family transcriptional regulator [Spirosoma agri]|jgi:predicted NBD/HSP70 family sugar kinase|uniref:ROK family protein n=1 Tax=Spirosoma agri TaxID=1987381 RepID=A0A6M0IEB4_9BACT|nr:ROK family transcriptional regulator [Spirosoma agri]NEU66554.1 ROK family protein [Spirosoma agri]
MHDHIVFSVIDAKKNKLKRQIINELYRLESRTISQLASRLHTSIPSTTSLIDELSMTQWVQGIGTGTAQYGRKPSLFALDASRYVTVVVDINVHDTKLLVFNLANQVVHQLDVDLRLDKSPTLLRILAEPLEQLAQRIKADQLQVVGVGAVLPGLVNPWEAVNHTYPSVNSPEQPLDQLLQSIFDAPVYLINDTKATIFGEHRFGLAQNKKHVLSVNIDWGIGLGVITNGEILQGSAGFAGELGHIQMKTDGELCSCGKVGCLETLASASSLIRRARIGLDEGRVSLLTELDSSAIDIERIIGKANAGDAFSIDLLSDVGSALGKALSTAVHLFNPELIIVNGVLAKAEKSITRPIEQAIDKYCLPNYRDNLSIELSKLGEMAKFYGTQAYVVQKLLEHELVP